ncbi:MAG: hypothetical protein ACR2LC_01960 [Pyrinomonadaceae bacterium]
MQRKFLKFCLMIAFAVLCGNTHLCAAQDIGALNLSEQGKSAYCTLSTVDAFNVGGFGLASATYKGEKALRVLLNEKHSLNAFKSLLDYATLEGQMYGLMGIHIKDKSSFDDEVKLFRVRSPDLKKVHVFEGCNSYWEDSSKVVERIMDGRYSMKQEPKTDKQ